MLIEENYRIRGLLSAAPSLVNDSPHGREAGCWGTLLGARKGWGHSATPLVLGAPLSWGQDQAVGLSGVACD